MTIPKEPSNRPATEGPSGRRIPSSASTGGGGTFFEQHVDAYWLALLLVRGIPPILTDCVVSEVSFQTEHLGWHTDDFLMVGQTGSGQHRKLVGQVKRSIAVSAADVEFKNAILDFWTDFNATERFTHGTDRFALVTLRGTNTLLEHFTGLLDCSRAARDSADFEHRLRTPGFLNKKVVDYCDEIRKIIGESEGRDFSAADLWPFLHVVHLLSLDLNTSTRQAEAAIKTLLAHSTHEPDAAGAAEATWNMLLNEVGQGMPTARQFRREDLPDALRQRHSPLGGAEERALQAIREHTALILDGIHSTIGNDFHLPRSRHVQQVIEKLESAQVVLLSGTAGVGKSGIAKVVIGVLAGDHFTCGFRAEEFAHPHLDAMLHDSQIPANASELRAILAGQDRIVILVESVERLLEKSTRDAFTDLLTLVSNDKSWRLVLTCRDYSSDLVRTSLLEAGRISHSVVLVPSLEDCELDEVAAAQPTLARPLAVPTLRKLLRNPYLLDKALQISWSEDRPLPSTELDFRRRCWQEIVRADQSPAGGMPRRRQDAFVQIALRRARSLSPYALCEDLDPEVVSALRRDSLIASPPQSDILLAPAHDVLEDWAILQWISEQYLVHGNALHQFSAAIGTHPAVRRSYRKWLSELAELDPQTTDQLFESIVHKGALSGQFRDDTLVSLLRSSSAPSFLARQRAALLTDDMVLLRQAIHLLRVACVTTPGWLPPMAQASLLSLPDGPAWSFILGLVRDNLDLFGRADDAFLLLGLIEDWARGVSWQTPYPDGSEHAAAIAHRILPGFDSYHSEDARNRTLQVIAKIPNADSEQANILLRGSPDKKGRDRLVEDFRKIIFDDTGGSAVARDMPDVLIAAAKDYLLCTEKDLNWKWGYAGGIELEPLFGIKYGRSHGFFPASAYRGPFFSLLRHHPREGLAFMIAVFNHSAEWYAHPRIQFKYVEPPFEMELSFADGTTRNQWCNERLWNLYRGRSVGPCTLQCLLMALERWLLEYAEAHPQDLDRLLLHILQRSDSAALSAVVGSVATAFPRISGEALLVLLRSPWCIQLDRHRFANDHASSRTRAGIPVIGAADGVYADERNEADALAHRRCDLEWAICQLQLGPFAPRVHEILDRHRAAMPPVEKQDEEDRIWRLALHRMDLRQYSVDQNAAAGPGASGEVVPGGDDGARTILLNLNAPDPDIKEMVDKSASQFELMNTRLGLLNWGVKSFERSAGSSTDPGQWREMPDKARHLDLTAGTEPGLDLDRNGPGIIAAVCVRDHWDEMSDEERGWSVSTICAEVEREGDHWDGLARIQLNSISADRPSACVLPFLIGKVQDAASRSRLQQMLVVAMTHAINEVRYFAGLGIGAHLSGADRELALRCVNAIATEAALAQSTVDAEFSQPYSGRRKTDVIEAEVARTIRRRFLDPDGITSDVYRTFDSTRGVGVVANKRVLTVLAQAPKEPVAIAAFQRFASTLTAWWDADDERRRNPRQKSVERDYHAESELSSLLENFLLRTTPAGAAAAVGPVVDAIDRHPDKVNWFLTGLIGFEDRQPNTGQFWSLWELFAQKVRRAEWLANVDREHSTGAEMISAIFLGKWWEVEVRHWRSLEGNAGRVDVLFENLPASSSVLSAYCRFLYHVGERSLPAAFIRVAKRLHAGDPKQMMSKGDTVFLLERLLRRYVHGRPLELKSQAELREAVLLLLDELVEMGSSSAFRMRDDFVTPAPVG